MNMDHKTFWDIRSEHYDKLYWTKDSDYISAIVAMADPDPQQLVLDVGSGTGIMARAIQPHVQHVVAVDLSDGMLRKGEWSGFSVVRWDISESLFTNALFDRVIARMVFHHVLEGFDRALVRCFDLLKPGGKIVIAEGIPPSSEPDVVDWYTEMFRYKEERRTITKDFLDGSLTDNGFIAVESRIHVNPSFSVKNWLENSGLDPEMQRKVMALHIEAPAKIKELYDMRITADDCVIRTYNLIVRAERPR